MIQMNDSIILIVFVYRFDPPYGRSQETEAGEDSECGICRREESLKRSPLDIQRSRGKYYEA